MSPEQARGQEVDARSDLFSFGVVLYEMLTGRAPFSGANALDVISNILKTEPAPLSSYAPDTPPELQRLVNKLRISRMNKSGPSMPRTMASNSSLHAGR